MMDALPPKGWAELSPCVCVRLCACVCLCMRACMSVHVCVCTLCACMHTIYVDLEFVCFVFICVGLTFLYSIFRNMNMSVVCHHWTQLAVTTGQIETLIATEVSACVTLYNLLKRSNQLKTWLAVAT